MTVKKNKTKKTKQKKIGGHKDGVKLSTKCNKIKCASSAWKRCKGSNLKIKSKGKSGVGSGTKFIDILDYSTIKNCTDVRCPKAYIVECLSKKNNTIKISNLNQDQACQQAGKTKSLCNTLTFYDLEDKVEKFKTPKEYKTKKFKVACIFSGNKCKKKKKIQ